jgi:hypothetical protein
MKEAIKTTEETNIDIVDGEKREPQLTKTEEAEKRIFAFADDQMRNEANHLDGVAIGDNDDKRRGDKSWSEKLKKSATVVALGLSFWGAVATLPAEAHGQSKEVRKFNKQMSDNIARFFNKGKTYEQSEQIERENERTLGIEKRNVQQILNAIDKMPIDPVVKVDMKRPYLDQLHNLENHIRMYKR